MSKHKHVMFADDSVTGEPSVDVRLYEYCDQQSQCSTVVSIDFSSFQKESGNVRASGGLRGSVLESWDNEGRQRPLIRNSVSSMNSNEFSVTDNQFKMNVDEEAAYFAMNRNSNSSSRTGSFHKGSQIQFDSAFDEESLADSVLSGTSFALDGLDGDSKLVEFALDDKSLEEKSEFDANSQSHPTTMYDEIGSDDFISLAEGSSESEESLKDPPPPSAPLMPSSSFMRSEKRKQRKRDRLRAYSKNPMRNGSLGSMSSIPRRNTSNRSLTISNPIRRGSLGTSSAHIPRRGSLGTPSSANKPRRNGSLGAVSSAHMARRGSLGTPSSANKPRRNGSLGAVSSAHIPRRGSLGTPSSANKPRRNGSLGAVSNAHIPRRGSLGTSNAHIPRLSSLGSNNARNNSLRTSSAHNPRRNGSLGSMAANNPRRDGSLGSMAANNPRRNGSLGALQKRASNSLKTQSCHDDVQRRAGSLRAMVRTQPHGINESEATAPQGNGETKVAVVATERNESEALRKNGEKKRLKAAANISIRKIISPKMEKAMKLKLGSDLPSGKSSPSISRLVQTPAQRQHLLG